MCIIDHFDEIYPNGQRHPLTHLRYCENGSPTRACRDVRHVAAENVWLPLPRAPQPPILVHAAEPRRKTQRTKTQEIHGFRKFSNNLKLVLNFGNPFSKMSHKKKEYVVVERGGKKRLERQIPRPREPSPRRTPPPPPHYDDPHIVQVPEHPQYQHHDPRIVQVAPQQPYDAHLIEPREVRRSHEGSARSTSSESPPTTPVRQHRRRHSVTSSEARRSEERRIDELRQERDRLRRENRNARAELDARLSAEREAAAERRRALRRAERQQDHEQHERLESAERARLRQEREDRDRLAAVARHQEERERLERSRAAGLTRRPRPGPVVHQRPRESIAARGDRVISEAIRAENLRRFEDQTAPRPGGGWDRRRDVGDGLRRRDTLAVGQRRIYDDDRRRGGRRWV